MKTWLFVLSSLLMTTVAQAELEFLRLTTTQQQRVQQLLENTQCTCGCDMQVGRCLIDDQTCPVSPVLAKAMIRDVATIGLGSSISAPQRNQIVSTQSDGGEWHERLSGKLLVYVSTTGGYRTKECTWLYNDGTFQSNAQGGSVSSLGTSAHSGSGHGTWGTQGAVITLNHPNGKQEEYKMSYDADGTLYLDHWRYFLVEHDNYACQ